MKKLTRKMVALITCLSVALSLATPGFATSVSEAQKLVVLQNYSDQELGTAKQVVRDGNTVIYLEVTPDMSYCAQITLDGRIQFSYYMIEPGIIYESPVYQIEHVKQKLNTLRTTDNDSFDLLNDSIQHNLDVFTGMKEHALQSRNTSARLQRSASVRDQAINYMFGTDYTQLFIDSATFTYNGRNYILNCRERNISSVLVEESQLFSEETAVSVIISWLAGGVFTWRALVETLVSEVVDIVIIAGIKYIASEAEIAKYDIRNVRTRQVSVDPSHDPIFYSAWERRALLITGSEGFAWDSVYFSNKHSDFDNPDLILQNAWVNYRDYVLG